MPWLESVRQTGPMPPGLAAKMRSSPSMPRPGKVRTFLERFEDAIGWPIDLIFRHFEKRLFELAMTVCMMGDGILLMLSPASVEASAFRYLTQALPLGLCIAIFLGLGGVRLVALALNGHWMPWGAYARAIGAVAGAVMWGQMSAALWTFGMWNERPFSPGIPIYTTLALFEIISMYVALIGARSHGIRH